jgi:hypothetical protein
MDVNFRPKLLSVVQLIGLSFILVYAAGCRGSGVSGESVVASSAAGDPSESAQTMEPVGNDIADGALPTQPASAPGAATPPAEEERQAIAGIGYPSNLPGVLLEALQIPKNYDLILENETKLRIVITISGEVADNYPLAAFYYAVAALFPTIAANISSKELVEIWTGSGNGEEERTLLMTAETYQVFSYLWGEASDGTVQIVQSDELVKRAWGTANSYVILPFDELDPRLKVMAVDGISIFDLEAPYSLKIVVGIEGDQAALDQFAEEYKKEFGESIVTNRDPEKMTRVILTGVTALVRRTALRMEENGVFYPGLQIRELLSSADITHVSNEVPFYDQCPPAEPLRTEARFCSNPSYIDLFEDIGVDIIELTGNHEMDWGAEAFAFSLDLYDERGFPYYGGGKNQETGQSPYRIEHNGNKIAFLGCNMMGPESDWATETSLGSASCDLEWMEKEIRRLRSSGVIPIVTFQHFELCDYTPQSSQRIDFQRMAEAGAVIVSGSQAHCPQTMTFINGSFVHYGLGNLFFDQMPNEYERSQFIDEHIFYDGRHLSTVLHTTILEDYAQPRLMTEEERERFLGSVFEKCEWSPVDEN